MSILKELEALGYDITSIRDLSEQDKFIRRLVDSIRVAQTADDKLKGAYFRSLLTWTVNGQSSGTKLDRLNAYHERIYAIVCDVMVTADIKPNPNDTPDDKARKYKERQRRVMFAVTAKSTILRALQAGVTLASDMSKGQIEALIKGAKVKPAVDHFAWSMRALASIGEYVKTMTPEQANAVIGAAGAVYHGV